MKTLIIAEAGVNHNGSLVLAKKLVDIAADAGADIVKFQSFKADKLVTKFAQKAEYQKITTGGGQNQLDMLKKLELSDEMHIEIKKHCILRNIEFLSTGFDSERVKYLLSLGISKIKIPSGEITNLPYLRFVGAQDKPVLLSTGMSHMQEISDAIKVLEMSGLNRNKISILHCTSEYPTPMENVNLRAMLSIREEFGLNVGYSDHTEGIEVAIAAVALGATIIEKHFTVDKSLPGPDHLASLEPIEIKQLVKSIRNIEGALGNFEKKATPAEVSNMQVARKSLVASRLIRKGEMFTSANVTIKRPGTGISPMDWDLVIGKLAIRDFSEDEIIEI
jgi:N,N'-diacetyllegionaminate synthase